MSPAATVFVCTACRRKTGDGDGAFDHPGPALAERIKTLLADNAAITVTPVECLAVCTRPCTVALTAANKWTYVVGDLDNVQNCEDVAAMARAYAASDNGIVAWRERPQAFRKGVVSRTPPVGFVQPQQTQE